jgi:hypothetical protein
VPTTKTVTGNIPVKTQFSHGVQDAMVHMWHLAMPWLAWLLLTILGLILRFLFPGYHLWSALFCLAFGLLIAVFDMHLRWHRASVAGRFIGPATAVLSTLVLDVFILAGISKPLTLIYFLGGLATCIIWDIWSFTGDKDLATTFNAKAEAAGVAGARLYGVREAGPGGAVPRGRGRRARMPRMPRVLKAGIQFPSEPVMTGEEVGDRVAHMEAATRSARGSWSVTADPRDGGLGEVTISDPALLTSRPLPWPGPSAEGADMSVPFRLGMLQTGQPFLYPRMPLHHRKTTGKTGSGKTESLCWCMFAEGVTRLDYAMFGMDPAKGEQFMGPLRPAMHGLALTDEDTLDMIEGLHRVRLARVNWLGRHRITEWYPGCGLSFLDAYLCEAAEVLKLLGRTAQDKKDGVFMLETWVGDIATGRSAGMSWTAEFQRATKEQAASAVASSQMGHVCFGVANADDAKFGLSELQRERGCRPALFNQVPGPDGLGPDTRGMAYFDTETVPEADKVMPLRFWSWGPGSSRIADYASRYPASDRPLDDVTLEALADRPARPASSGFPGPRRGRGKAPDGPAADKKPGLAEAIAFIRRQVIEWRLDGRTEFTALDLQGSEGFKRSGRVRTWLYDKEHGPITQLEEEGLIRYLGDKPKQHWGIAALPEPVVDLNTDELDDAEGEDD